MRTPTTLNPVDVIFALVIVLAIFRGYSKGLLGTAAGYVGPVAAFMIAADWSDPVRDRIAAAMPIPDIFLDMLAPLIVFVVVVAAVRIAAAFFARLLGVGLSMPGRILASVAGATATALVLGSFVLLVHEMRPEREPNFFDDKDTAGEVLTSPVDRMIRDIDRRFAESLLAPPLAEFASAVVSEALLPGKSSPLLQREEVEAAARNAAAAAAATVGNLPVGKPAQQGGGNGR